MVTPQLTRFFPAALLILNFGTKACFLTEEEIGLDEPFSIYHAQFSAGTIIEQLKSYNNPPLFELLLHFWIGLFGISPLAVRTLPLLFACLAPVALYFFARRHFPLRVAVISSLLLSFSSLLVYYAHDCRVYSLFVLLSILSVHFYLRCLEGERSKKVLAVAFVLTSVLLVYAHYFGFFILFLQGLHLLVYRRDRLLRASTCYAAVLLLYLPHLFPLVDRMNDSVSKGTWLEPPMGIESLYNMLWSFSNKPVLTVLCIFVLLAAAAKFILTKRPAGNPGVVFLILSWFLFAWLGMFLISFSVPMYIDRYLIYALPAYYLLLALAINQLVTKRAAIAGAVLAFCFAASVDLNPDKKQPLREAMSIIQQNKSDSTLVVVQPRDFLPVFAYHYDRAAFASVADGREYNLTDSLLRVQGIYHDPDAFTQTLATAADLKHVLFFTTAAGKYEADAALREELAGEMKEKWGKELKPEWQITAFER